MTRVVVGTRWTAPLALVALIALVCGSLIWRYHAAERDADAQARLALVISTFNDTVDSRSGKEGFERVIREAAGIQHEFGGSREAQLAQYYIAISEEHLGRTENAVRAFEALIRDGDSVMKPLAQFALGTLYQNHRDTSRAIEIYDDLVQSGAYKPHHGSPAPGAGATAAPHAATHPGS